MKRLPGFPLLAFAVLDAGCTIRRTDVAISEVQAGIAFDLTH